MDTDKDNEEIQENFISKHKTIYEYIQRFLPEQTILYIQYCLLRIPLLIIYDYLFTKEFYILIETIVSEAAMFFDDQDILLLKPITFMLNSFFFQLLISINLILSLPVLGFILLIIFLMCSDRRLVRIYSYTISCFIIYFSYHINYSIITKKQNFILHLILSLIYHQMLNIQSHKSTYKIQKRFCYFSLILHLIIRYLLPFNFSLYLLDIYYCLWSIIQIFDLIFSQYDTIKYFIRFGLINQLISSYDNFSAQITFNYLYENIHLTVLLKLFWLIKVFILPLGIREIYKNPYIITKNQTEFNETLPATIYFTCIFYGTETMFTLISLACIVSYGMKIVSYRLFRRLQIWSEDVEQIGIVMGVMFFLLLFQSNLNRLDLNQRHVPLLKAFSLLIVALFHFIHTTLEPQLLKVAMQTVTNTMAFQEEEEENKFSNKFPYISKKILYSFHHRYIYTSVSILILLILYIFLLWNVTTFSTWLLAITAFLLELIVRLIASLAQYTLYVFDAHNCLSTEDSFDEYIFRIKALTSIVEFILAIFLLFNGFYILYYESRGALRAFMLAIHAYLNIVKNLRRGWTILRNRQSAWNHVNKLPLATEEQIENYNDICSICHGILTVGITCITPCSHFFHKKCLQKTFYTSQNCALCLRPIIVEQNTHEG